MQPQAPGSQGARCALHLGQPFTAVCQRCGSYMCETCTERGKFTVCESCRSRAGIGAFPFRRDRFTWGELLAYAFSVYKRNFALLLAAGLIATTSVIAIQGLSFLVTALLADHALWMLSLQGLLVIPQVVIQGVATLGMLEISARITRGEPADLGMLFGAWRKLGRFLLQNLLVYVASLPVMLLFAVPIGFMVFLMSESPGTAIGVAALMLPVALFAGAYVVLGLAFAGMEIAAQDRVGALEGLKNSWAIARARRLAIFTCFLLCALSFVAGLLACGVGVFFSMGYALVLYATVYLTLRNGAQELAT